jgi:phytoene dehydrogenase-like protein
LGEIIESTFADDLVRGVVFTDGKIGALTHAHDATLLQNRTFLYHVIGNETGEWRVPVGGMGALTDALIDAAKSAGAELLPNSTATVLYPGRTPSIYCLIGEQPRTINAKWVLVNATPSVLAHLVSAPPPPKPNGSVFKINMVLKRLPRLRSSEIAPEDAFAGTIHFSEGYAAMQDSYRQAASSIMPNVPPGEVYCHSLTDSSILGESVKDLHTLTLFGLDMPYSLFEANPDAAKAEALRRYLAGINDTLSEPIEDCLALDANGKPCIDAKSPVDLEHELNMTGGNIFHRDLAWPFAETDQEAGTWGVETEYTRVLLCGAGARRGGGVSGIAGYNAAQKLLNG